jgi:hypothetical protein
VPQWLCTAAVHSPSHRPPTCFLSPNGSTGHTQTQGYCTYIELCCSCIHCVQLRRLMPFQAHFDGLLCAGRSGSAATLVIVLLWGPLALLEEPTLNACDPVGEFRVDWLW